MAVTLPLASNVVASFRTLPSVLWLGSWRAFWVIVCTMPLP